MKTESGKKFVQEKIKSIEVLIVYHEGQIKSSENHIEKSKTWVEDYKQEIKDLESELT